MYKKIWRTEENLLNINGNNVPLTKCIQRFLLLAVFLGVSTGALAKLPDPLWYSWDEHGQLIVHMHFFRTTACIHCQETLPFIAALEKKYAWLRVHDYELTHSPANVEVYQQMAKLVGQAATSVPAFLFCKTMETGFGSAETTGRQLEAKLIACSRYTTDGMPSPVPGETLTLPVLGDIKSGQYSLPVLTLLIAGLDAFNPCAFFVLLFLMSLLIHSQSRVRMATIGGLFVFFSGMMYFIFMAAWLNLFLLVGQLTIITLVAGFIAVLIGAINVKDYFYLGKGISLSIPSSGKPRLFEKMRRIVEAGHWSGMVAATMILAMAANSYEILCTAGFPMVYTRILTLNQLSGTEYYLYLALYNLIYIIPLLFIVTVFVITMGAKKLGEREGRWLKLLSGLMMLGLGILLIFAPKLLSNVVAAALLVGGSVLVTALRVWREHTKV